MSRTRHRSFSVPVGSILLAAAAALPAAETASDWPHWRGPTGNGTSPDGRPPAEWGPSKNLRWKVEIPGSGYASPIVWRDRVFVATAVPAGGSSEEPRAGGRGGPGEEERRGRRRGRGRGRSRSAPDTPQRFTLICLDRATGKTRWQSMAAETTPHQGKHETNTFASASPTTDGERVFAHFGSRGIFCYDLEGDLIWKRTDLGRMRTRNDFGEGSSPTVHGDRVIVPWDHEGPSFLIALDKKNGKTIWKEERDEPSCWATPLVVEHDGGKQIIMNGQNYARGYDFESGKELWRSSGQTGRPVASPVAGHGLAFIGSGFRGAFLGAFRLDRTGDIDGTDGVAWTLDRGTPDVPSPLLSGRRLYFHHARTGTISCLDALSGKPRYPAERLEGVRSVYASPVGADGRIYFTGRDGTTVVIEDGDEFEVVATNRLGEGVDATPAIAGREIFIRGSEHLHCFAE